MRNVLSVLAFRPRPSGHHNRGGRSCVSRLPARSPAISSPPRRFGSDAEFAELVAQHLRGEAPTFARSIDELIDNHEDDAVEFKSTARWDLREQLRNPALEEAIVKTVARACSGKR